MINASWKQRLIRYAHISRTHQIPLHTPWDFPKTVLGRKVLLRHTMTQSLDWLKKIKGEIRQDEFLSEYTSIRIGGPADLFIVPEGVKDLITIYQNAGDKPVFILGEGTNLLVRDRGLRGIVICLRDGFKSAKDISLNEVPSNPDKVLVRAGAGVKMSYLSKYTARNGLSGLEMLAGIPGSLGGSLIMNAGAEGTEIGSFVRSVTRVTEKGRVEVLNRNQLIFKYRKTLFPPGGGVIVEAELELSKDEPVKIQSSLNSYLQKRNRAQPLNIPNSGSVFKNPKDDKAGRLIEKAGLKGFTIGGASVSIKHANFIVNKGSASAEDVLKIIEHIRSEVWRRLEVQLETEIIVVGE